MGRDEVVRELRRRLIPVRGKDSHTVQLITAVRGWPGVGKTTVAAALAHDPELATAFPDGLLWASLGQEPKPIRQLETWARELGGALLELNDLKDKRFSIYVPHDLVPQISAAIARGQRVQELLSEAGVRFTQALKERRNREKR